MRALLFYDVAYYFEDNHDSGGIVGTKIGCAIAV